MARRPRIVVPGYPHHVQHCGNNGQDLFVNEHDREFYLRVLRQRCQRHGVGIEGYCLMPNYVDLIAVPGESCALARAVGLTHWFYALHFNRCYGRRGHLWNNRFDSCPMDLTHTWQMMCCIERNPVCEQLVRHAWDYPWSSAAAHAGKNSGDEMPSTGLWQEHWTTGQWRDFLLHQDPACCARIRQHTRSGRPLGSAKFVRMAEQRTTTALIAP